VTRGFSVFEFFLATPVAAGFDELAGFGEVGVGAGARGVETWAGGNVGTGRRAIWGSGVWPLDWREATSSFARGAPCC